MSGIVTNGLIGYWHFKEGFKGNAWENIAPDTKGSFNGVVHGATLQEDGVRFDGVDDFAIVSNIVNNNPSIAIEVYYYHNIRGIGGNQSSVGVYPVNLYKNTSLRFFSQKHNDATYNYADATSSSNFNNINGVKKISDYEWHQVFYQYNHVTNKKEIYINGVLDTSVTVPQRNWQNSFDMRLAVNHYNGVNSGFSSAVYASVRLYNRALTATEVQQNYTVGKEVGLVTAPIELPPIVTKLVADKSIVSDEPGVNQSIITVQFDTNVTEYVARLNGTSHDTGEIVHQGGVVAANTDAQIIIDWDELTSEGVNRINVYGKNASGDWTKYEA